MRHLLIGTLFGSLLLGAGCSSQDRPQSESNKNFKALTVLYGKYISRNKGVGPSSEADFKKFIKSLNAAEVQSLGVDPADIDGLFVSPRDNQPYQFAWRIHAKPQPDGSGATIMWEQTGVGGKRLVGDSLGNTEELDEAAFTKRVGPAAKSK